MKLTHLVNIPTPAPAVSKGAPRPAAAKDPQTVSSFVSPQSLVTFPGASFVVAILTQAIRSIVGAEATSPVVPFIISLVVGAIILLVSISDDNNASRPKNLLEWVIAVFIAFVNSVVLYMAAIGAIQAVAATSTNPSGGP